MCTLMWFLIIIKGGIELQEGPEGWPGTLILEGRTLAHIPIPPVTHRGPAAREGSGFLNPAMAGSRTRSVMLLADALENDWLVPADKPIRIIEALAATGIRSRRWLNEIPEQHLHRLHVLCNDIDPVSMQWAEANLKEYPAGIDIQLNSGDARSLMLDSGWQWIDIDPFGSPTPFIDSAIQSCSRLAVLDVCATDTAALTGSSPSACRRRYDAMAVVDDLRHDTGMRILLGALARAAARHDRVISPKLVIFDDHHIRATVLVRRSKEAASELHSCLGWRVHSPNERELKTSMSAGLHPQDDSGLKQPSCILPFNHPPELKEGRVSGPIWIGSLGDQQLLERMTEERVLELCSPDSELQEAMNWSDKEMELAERRLRRSVRGLSDSASAIDCPVVLPVDDIPKYLELPGPPSPSQLARTLRLMGYRAAIAVLQIPAIRTDAPWSVISEAALEVFGITHPK